jgi:hypothetical protein
MSRDYPSKRGPKSHRETASYPFDDNEGTSWLLSFVVGAAISQCAVRVGLTRDGGALALGIYAGDEYGVEYIRPDEDLGTSIREISLGWHIPCAIFDEVAGRWIIPQ